MMNDLRAAFDSDRTRSKAWRVGQLRAFLTMIDQDGPALCQALLVDLHKSPLEGYLTELALVKSEIETALECLDEWMSPIKTNNSALNIPCWSTTQRDPLGVVLIMGAWNYPMQLTLAPLVGAIAGGNCVLIKPGSYAIKSSHTLASLINKYFDKQCIRAIEGNRDVTTAILNETFETIFYTGSAFVGKIVAQAAARNIRPCVLELGGKSPTIIDSTADLEHAVSRLIWGTFLNGGQTCVRPDFVMVHDSVAKEFFELCKKYITKYYGENPQKTEWFGRCINDQAFQRLDKLVKDSTGYCSLIAGGVTDSADKYISPTILDFGSDIDAFRSSAVMSDELFGPILPCIRYKNLETVIQFIRQLPTGKPLALYCFSRNQNMIKQVKERTSSGGLVINDCLMHLANHELPFGGIGNSGMGSYHGVRSFNAFTHEKAVLEKSAFLDQSILFKPLLAARFPPYTPTKTFLVKMFSLHWVSKAVNYPVPIFRKLVLLLGLISVSYALGIRVQFQSQSVADEILSPLVRAITAFLKLN